VKFAALILNSNKSQNDTGTKILATNRQLVSFTWTSILLSTWHNSVGKVTCYMRDANRFAVAPKSSLTHPVGIEGSLSGRA
jgi:hypothetical protein